MTKTNLYFPLYLRCKVRDIYDLGDSLLMVATDRISAFDVVIPTGIPYKGATLTELSRFWFNETNSIIANHLLDKDVPDQVRYRGMIVKKSKPLVIECIVRGYLAGSGWREYQKTGAVCGIKLPEGLRESDRLPQPIFTPSTKADQGHDINISFDEAARLVGDDIAAQVRDRSLELYEFAARRAEKNGIIIADTKFEFGMSDGKLMLIDEVLTPDSSRFWPMSDYEPGRSQKSFDKQYVRDYLSGLDWDKKPPAPELPENIVNETSRKYLEAYERITQKKPEFV